MSYGGYNPYGGNGGGCRGYGADPFDDRNALQYGAGNHEMSSFNSGGSPQMGQQGYGSPRAQGQNSILDECIDIQNQAQELENKLGALSGLQKRYLDDADTSGGSNTRRDLDNLTQSMMDQYKGLTDRVRAIKSNPDCRDRRNVSQVNKTDRDVRRAIQKFQELEVVSRKEIEERSKRLARIAHPDATEDEITTIVNSDTQVFAQAVMGNRAENANRTLGAHKERNQKMKQIEQQLIELLEILSETQELLHKQEVTIATVDEQIVDTNQQMDAANTNLGVATTTARATRKKKWWCLGICVVIVVIIVVAVVAYILVNRAANGGGGGGGTTDNSNNNNGDNTGTGGTTGDNTGTNTGTGTTGETTGDNTATQRRSPFRRNLLEDLQMNTGRAVKISPDVVPRFPRRLASRARRAGVAANQDVEALAKKRFVVDWQGADPTGSDD
ncbi:t-SNARE [Chaetomium fimeti]|uniref:t-SNARE n=1 Tax=Chaetomium fimeti TaxID=1854472 RepID=A0AAE0LNQ1_9PEZI|nr:t-SNARE [Chaetomium fimeti]